MEKARAVKKVGGGKLTMTRQTTASWSLERRPAQHISKKQNNNAKRLVV
jgi:hypothetical protein